MNGDTLPSVDALRFPSNFTDEARPTSELASFSRQGSWEGADLAMEVVREDPKDQVRDYQTKVADYAAAGIPEYWIVDPFERRIRVLVLEGDTYQLHGDFRPDEFAASVLLPGFTVAVSSVLAGGDEA